MRKLLIVLMFALSINLLNAQNYTTHKVKPGESFASIAEKYGISEKDLRSDNELISVCYVGANLTIRHKILEEKKCNCDDNKPDANHSHEWSSVAKDAISLYESGYYLKARNLFTKILKDNSVPVLYYYRGLCGYNMGNWKDAVDDLSQSLARPGLDSLEMVSANALLSDARQKREQQVQNRREAWAAVGTAVLVAGAVAADMYVRAYTAGTNSPSCTYKASAVSEYKNKDNYGSDAATTSTSTPKGKTCPHCMGSGKCSTCNGTGMQDKGFGLGKIPCANCAKTTPERVGKCQWCSGKGIRY